MTNNKPIDTRKIGMDIIVDLNILKRLLGHHTMGGVRAAMLRIRENAEKLTKGIDRVEKE